MAHSKIITYDLCNSKKNYEDLYEYLRSFSLHARVTESTWIVSSTKSCKTIRDELNNILDSDDCYFVGKLSGESAWHNALSGSEKLKEIL